MSQARWKAKPGNSEKCTVAHRKRKFGLSADDQRAMLEAQGHRCAACRDPLTPGRGTHLDHDHRTGAVRGFVCEACNRAVGAVKDDPNRALMLAAYLERHGARPGLAATG